MSVRVRVPDELEPPISFGSLSLDGRHGFRVGRLEDVDEITDPVRSDAVGAEPAALVARHPARPHIHLRTHDTDAPPERSEVSAYTAERLERVVGDLLDRVEPGA